MPLCLLMLLLAGCSGWSPVAVTPVPSPSVPASWTQATLAASGRTGATEAELGWLGDFADLALPGLVAEAVEGNPGIAAARARLAEGEGGVRLAGAGRLPSVDVSGQGSRSRSATAAGSVISERFTANLTFAWEADVWGRVAAGAEAAEVDRDALALDLVAARQSLAAGVARAWFDVIEGQQQVELSEALVANLETHRAALRRGYRQGIFGAAEVQLAESNLAGEAARLAERQRVLGDRQRALEVMLGRYPSAALRPAQDLPPLPAPVPAGLPSGLLERRADLRAAQQRAVSAGLRQLAAHRDRLPRLTLTASAGHSSADLANLLSGRAAVWSLLGGVVQPLIDGGRREGAEQQAAARVTQAQARYVDVVLQAFADVEGALAQESRLRTQIDALAASVAAARRAEAMADQEYRAGIEGTLALLEVKRRTYAARSGLLDARWRQLRNRVNLYLALGGDFAAPVADAENGR